MPTPDAQRQPVAELLPVAAPQQLHPQPEHQAGQHAGQHPHGESGLWRARPQIMGERVAGQCAAEIERHNGIADHSRRVEALLNVDHGAGGLWLDGQVEVVPDRQSDRRTYRAPSRCRRTDGASVTRDGTAGSAQSRTSLALPPRTRTGSAGYSKADPCLRMNDRMTKLASRAEASSPRGLLGERPRHPGDALVADEDLFDESEGGGIPDRALRGEHSRHLLP